MKKSSKVIIAIIALVIIIATIVIIINKHKLEEYIKPEYNYFAMYSRK